MLKYPHSIMVNGEKLARISGISIGGARSSVPDVVEAFEAMGVKIAPMTVSCIRGGFDSGDLIAKRIMCAAVLETGVSKLKAGLYHQLAQIGSSSECQKPQSEPNDFRLNSTGFTEEIANVIGTLDQPIRPKRVSIALRAMRADMISVYLEDPDDESVRLFQNTAEEHRVHFTERGTYRSKPTRAIYNAWSGTCPAEYYRTSYQIGCDHVMRTWAPYEIRVLNKWYERQEAQGAPLSPFDIAVLEGFAKGRFEPQIAAEESEKSGIPMWYEVIQLHRNVLIYGILRDSYLDLAS